MLLCSHVIIYLSPVAFSLERSKFRQLSSSGSEKNKQKILMTFENNKVRTNMISINYPRVLTSTCGSYKQAVTNKGQGKSSRVMSKVEIGKGFCVYYRIPDRFF